MDCLVHEYDVKQKRFKIVWSNQKKTQAKWVHRMNLQFDFDEAVKMEKRRKMALEKKELFIYYSSVNMQIEHVKKII
jgi:hypothetical protein